MRRRLVVSFAVIAGFAGAALAADPKIPAAQDPGLVPVAIVDAGIDYTDTVVAVRLARDGEHNIVGWDFVDNDIFPYATGAPANARAKLLLANPQVELVPIRVDPASYADIARAVAFTAQSPARVLVVTSASARREDWDLFVKATQHFRDLLILIPAGQPGVAFPAALKLDNVLSVAPPSMTDARADVAFATPHEADVSHPAVALAAALATCHAAAMGHGDGKARKSAILARLATPRSVSKIPAVAACP